MSRVRYRVVHETRYDYEEPVPVSQQLLHLEPRTLPAQRLLEQRMQIDPEPAELHSRNDFFGNSATWIAIRQPHTSLRVVAESLVEIVPRDPAAVTAPGPPWEEVVAALDSPPDRERLEPLRFRDASPAVPLLPAAAALADTDFRPGRPLLEALRDFNLRLRRTIAFDPRATTASTPLATVLELRRGVCQDIAHVALAALRHRGLAARYVSGYLLTTPPPGRPRLVGADASHAWISVWCPELGWIEFDPTNGLQPDTGHIVLGWGRDVGDVVPMRGVILGSGAHRLKVAVTVEPLPEAAGDPFPDPPSPSDPLPDQSEGPPDQSSSQASPT